MHTTVPTPYLREHAEQFIPRVQRHWAEGREATWGIRHDGRLAGMIGLYRREPDAAELGFWMAPWARRPRWVWDSPSRNPKGEC